MQVRAPASERHMDVVAAAIAVRVAFRGDDMEVWFYFDRKPL
jgi:hypothetical protein